MSDFHQQGIKLFTGADVSTILALHGVAKAFGENSVLRDVTMDVPKGSVTALIGPSGSGKTVMLKCAAGLMRRDAGTIDALGTKNVDDWGPLRSNIGVLFQRNALFDSMSVRQNVAFPLERRGMPAAAAREEAGRLLSYVGLDQRAADNEPSALSGGMRKRAALARAVAGNPELLLLDDPTAGLDPVLAASMEQLVRSLVQRRGASALVVTADVQNLPQRFDFLAILDGGVIAWQGPASEAGPSLHPLLAD